MKKIPQRLVCGALLLALSSSMVCHIQANPPGKTPTTGTPPTTQQAVPAAIPADLKAQALAFNTKAAAFAKRPTAPTQKELAELKQEKKKLHDAIVTALTDKTLTHPGAYEIALLLMTLRIPADSLQKNSYIQYLKSLVQLRNQIAGVQMYFDPKDGYTGALHFATYLVGNKLADVVL